MPGQDTLMKALAQSLSGDAALDEVTRHLQSDGRSLARSSHRTCG